jgi:hypothetical protein
MAATWRGEAKPHRRGKDLMQGKAGLVGQTPRVHRVRQPLGGDSNKEVIEVIKTFKINVVWTVLVGGYVWGEGRKERILAE